MGHTTCGAHKAHEAHRTNRAKGAHRAFGCHKTLEAHRACGAQKAHTAHRANGAHRAHEAHRACGTHKAHEAHRTHEASWGSYSLWGSQGSGLMGLTEIMVCEYILLKTMENAYPYKIVPGCLPNHT